MKIFLRIFALALSVCLAFAADAQPVEEKEYLVLELPRAASPDNRIEVLEFFYYGCPVCYEAQPHIAHWLNNAANAVTLRRVPAAANEGWRPFARSYYTLEAMDEVSRLHWPVYDNFHFDGRDLLEESAMLEWVARNGVDPDRFKEIWNSAATSEKIEAARKLLDRYNIRGVPSIVVDGRYVTSARMAGDTKRMMDVVDALVSRARRERGQ